MRIHEAAALVEREGLPAVARTRKQRMKLIFIVFAYIRNHSSPIPFPLKERMNCQVFQFQYAVPLISNHRRTFCPAPNICQSWIPVHPQVAKEADNISYRL